MASSALDIMQDMSEFIERAKAEHKAGLRALQEAEEHFAERDRAIRAVLSAPGARPSQRELARILSEGLDTSYVPKATRSAGLSPGRVAQIAKGTR